MGRSRRGLVTVLARVKEWMGGRGWMKEERRGLGWLAGETAFCLGQTSERRCRNTKWAG